MTLVALIQSETPIIVARNAGIQLSNLFNLNINMDTDIIFGPRMRPGELAGWVTRSPMLGTNNSIYDFCVEITKWLKKEGDNIQKDEIILGVRLDIVINTEDGIRTIPIACELKAPYTGKITKLNFQEGEKIKLGDKLLNFDVDSDVMEEEDNDEDYIKFEDTANNKVIDIKLDFAEEFTIKEWKKQIGDFIKEDEVLLNVDINEENSDVTFSGPEGILVEILYNEGESFKKDDVIAKVYLNSIILNEPEEEGEIDECDLKLTVGELETETASKLIKLKINEYGVTSIDCALSVFQGINSDINIEDEDEYWSEFYRLEQNFRESLIGKYEAQEYCSLHNSVVDRQNKIFTSLKRENNSKAIKWFYYVLLDSCHKSEIIKILEYICDVINLFVKSDYDVERPKIYNKLLDYLEFLLDRYNLHDLDFIPDLTRRDEEEE